LTGRRKRDQDEKGEDMGISMGAMGKWDEVHQANRPLAAVSVESSGE
jgi:hypothetical protein